MIHYFLLVNKQGQTRISKYYGKYLHPKDRSTLEGEIIRRCLRKASDTSSFLDFGDYRLVFRCYASLFFILAVSPDENELAMLEFIHIAVEALDSYFQEVCELDIMFNSEIAHFILDEMISAGQIVDTNKRFILQHIRLLQKSSKKT